MQVLHRPARQLDFETTLEIKKQALGPYIKQVWGWDDNFQRQYHQHHFDPAATSLLHYGGEEVGWLEVREAADCLVIQNLLIKPAFQRQGIGSFVLRQLVAQAAGSRKPVRLNVLKVNTGAFKLYSKLGFTVLDSAEHTIQMVIPAKHHEHQQ